MFCSLCNKEVKSKKKYPYQTKLGIMTFMCNHTAIDVILINEVSSNAIDYAINVIPEWNIKEKR